MCNIYLLYAAKSGNFNIKKRIQANESISDNTAFKNNMLYLYNTLVHWELAEICKVHNNQELTK